MTGDFGNLLYSHSLLCHTYVQSTYQIESESGVKRNHVLNNPPLYTQFPKLYHILGQGLWVEKSSITETDDISL